MRVQKTKVVTGRKGVKHIYIYIYIYKYIQIYTDFKSFQMTSEKFMDTKLLELEFLNSVCDFKEKNQNS